MKSTSQLMLNSVSVIRSLAWLTCWMMMTSASALAQLAEKPTCAILTFEAKGGEISTTAVELLNDRFSTEFDRLGKYRMVSRSQMKAILAAQKYSLSDACAANECAVAAGQCLGVQYIVYGTIGKLGNVYTINSFMADVETAGQVRSATTDSRGGIEEALTALMAVNARQLLGLEVPEELAQQLKLSSRSEVPDQASSDYIYNNSHPDSGAYFRPEPKQSVRPTREPQDIYFIPKVGVSMYSGIGGVEAQIAHVGLSIGLIDADVFTSGLKYYFDRNYSSWYLGTCFYYYPDSEDHFEEYFVGAGVGYRWRFWPGWDLTLGAGAGVGIEPDTYDDEITPSPVIDLSLGYAF